MKPRIPESNYNVILNAATNLAEKIGRDLINFSLVADSLNISRTVLYNHFHTVGTLKHEVLMNALVTDNILLLIEALIFGHIGRHDISKKAHEKILEFFK